MEKRRIRLEINGVVCGLVTRETDEYMDALAREVGGLMEQIRQASPYITREAAALTAALGYCDDLKKAQQAGAPGGEEALRARIQALEEENRALREQVRSAAESAPGAAGPQPPAVKPHAGNPMRYEDRLDQLGLVSFFERDHEQA